MTVKRKKKREYAKELKIERGVFDEYTLLHLYKLLEKTRIMAESLVKEGKESVILAGRREKNGWVAIKIYRIKACDFKSMWKYLVNDQRFIRLRRNRRFIVNTWCQREYRNLKLASTAGIDCPKPIAFNENILIMSFIGEEGIPAPMLINADIPNPKKVYERVVESMKKLAKVGLVHGDLSPYNILFMGKPFFIDFSHGTMLRNIFALELLKRDVENINSYFSKLNVPVKESNTLYEELISLIRK